MADESNEQQGKKRKVKWTNLYTKFTIRDAEKRAGIRFPTLEDNAIPVKKMLDGQSKLQRRMPLMKLSGGFTAMSQTILKREREIIAVGIEPEAEAGGEGGFVVMDLISVREDRLVIVIGSPLDQAMKQCLLSMFDMRGNNSSGKVFGFITTRERQHIVIYDGTLFQLT